MAVPLPDTEKAREPLNTLDLLRHLETNAQQTAPLSANIAPDFDLKGEVLKSLVELLGATAPNKVDKVAEKYPPTEKPLEFLSSCKRIIESAFGRTVAERTLNYLYKRLEK